MRYPAASRQIGRGARTAKGENFMRVARFVGGYMGEGGWERG